MDPYIGEIRMFAGNFAPKDWAFCHGQLLPIATNTALFSLLGTSYGGDGRSTFALPDLRNRALVSAGSHPLFGDLDLGQTRDPGSAQVVTGISPARQLGHTDTTASAMVFPSRDAPYLGLNFIIALQGVFPPRA